jgi:hypothetical protein
MEEWTTTVAMSEPIETHIREEREVSPYFDFSVLRMEAVGSIKTLTAQLTSTSCYLSKAELTQSTFPMLFWNFCFVTSSSID